MVPMGKKESKKRRIIKATVSVTFPDADYPVESEAEAQKILSEQEKDFGEWSYEWTAQD